jgi:predicted ATP-dependent endonuclease of OLD family
MHKLGLKKILISNFKGIKEVDLAFDSENNSIKGNTKIGKSSIYDAFTFLLFGTDSLKTSRFDVLPTITDGIDRIASVSGEFDIWHNDSYGNISLKRVYKPTKNGGSTSKYFIDDKNVSKTVYYKRVTDDVFAGDVKMANILSSPTYFFEKLTNEEQRAFVLNVIGEVSIDSIIKDHPRFASILELKNDTITERQKFVREKKD